MRTGSPTPVRDANERSKLLDRSEGGEHVVYGAEQAERVERRRQSSSYAVVNTGSTSGVGAAVIPGISVDEIGEPPIPCAQNSLLKERIGYMHSWFIRTFGPRGKGVSHQELEEADELLRSSNSVDPRLLLVIVRLTIVPPTHSALGRTGYPCIWCQF